jgi:apolipoprotein N-acyltransferase
MHTLPNQSKSRKITLEDLKKKKSMIRFFKNTPFIHLTTMIAPARMIFLGALPALAYAPLFWAHFFFCASALLCRTLYHTSQRGFFLGWLYGFGFFLSSLFWVGNSLFLDANFAWLWPFGVVLLPSFFALYIACTSAFLVFLKRRFILSPIRFGIVFALMFSMAEWVQGHLFTGFPWTVCSAIWIQYLSMAQWVSCIGVYGLGFVTWMASGLLSSVFIPSKKNKKQSIVTLSFIILIFFVLWAWGHRRLALNPTRFHNDVILRLVQPAMPLKERMHPDFYQKYAHNHLSCLLDLSLTSTPKAPTCILWPEGSFPWPLHKKTLNVLKQLKVSPLLMQSTYQEGGTVYNGLIAHSDPTKFIYAKKHLLPFGEYIPRRKIIERIIPKHLLKKITPGDEDFTPGKECAALYAKGCPPFFCFMCYEIIFPGTVQRKSQTHAQWILNPTNDGWFGHSPGPYQHLALAQLRAIECGLPIVRVAHNGISTVIDPLGRLIHTIPLGQRDFKDANLPQALPTTPFAQYGHWLYGGIILITILDLCVYVKRKKLSNI